MRSEEEESATVPSDAAVELLVLVVWFGYCALLYCGFFVKRVKRAS